MLTRVVLGRGAFDHWESGMDMRFGADMHDSFVKYQSRVISALDRMAKRYNFVVIDATKTPDQIFRELQRSIGKLFPASVSAAPPSRRSGSRAPRK